MKTTTHTPSTPMKPVSIIAGLFAILLTVLFVAPAAMAATSTWQNPTQTSITLTSTNIGGVYASTNILAVGDALNCTGATAAGLTHNALYYVIGVTNGSPNVYLLSTSPGGSKIGGVTGNGTNQTLTGVCVWDATAANNVQSKASWDAVPGVGDTALIASDNAGNNITVQNAANVGNIAFTATTSDMFLVSSTTSGSTLASLTLTNGGGGTPMITVGGGHLLRMGLGDASLYDGTLKLAGSQGLILNVTNGSMRLCSLDWSGFSGGITIQNGEVDTDVTDALRTGSTAQSVTIGNGSTATYAGLRMGYGGSINVDALNGTSQSRIWTANSAYGLTVGYNGGSGTFAGVIGQDFSGNTNALSLTKAGGGTFALMSSKTNFITGALTVSGGNLVIGSGTTLGYFTNAASTNTAALTVGNTAGSSASLTLTNATLVTGAESYFGKNTGASGNTLTVGAGGLWNLGNQLFHPGYGLVTNNLMLITDGGVVTNVSGLYSADIGAGVGNSLIISNNGALYVTGTFGIGAGGGNQNNQLLVTAGGKLYTTGTSVVGYAKAVNDAATVTGSGSLWDNGGQPMRVGGSSAVNIGTNNVLYVINGGVVSNVAATYLPDYNAALGNGIVISNGGSYYGTGVMDVGQGSGSISNYYYVGGLGAGSFATNNGIIVGASSSSGTFFNQVIVTNATLRSGNTVYVGNNAGSAFNSISVLAGGILDLNGNLLDTYYGASNSVIINGGVVTNVGNFICGDKNSSLGQMVTVSGGGKLYTAGANYNSIGQSAGVASNSVVVTDSGSVWNAGGKTVTVGTVSQTTNCTLTVQSGGVFTNGSITVSVSGGGGVGHSLVVNGGTVYANALAVNTGGSVSLTGGSSDALYVDNLGNGDGGMVITGAAPTASSLIAGWKNATSTNNSLITGNIALTKAGSGTLTMTNISTYAGNTTISAGTLELAQNVAVLATNSTVSIAAGAYLQLDVSTVTNKVASLVTNGIAAGNGVYGSANSAGFITGAGYLQVGAVSTGPTGPGYITNSITGGNTLNLTWPAGQGWTLVSQTNPLSIGLAHNWGKVNSAGDGSYSVTVDPNQPAVFYMLTNQ